MSTLVVADKRALLVIQTHCRNANCGTDITFQKLSNLYFVNIQYVMPKRV
jgi:hypothetical protein